MKKLIIVYLLMLMNGMIQAQNNPVLQAYEQSYSFETEENYVQAIEEIRQVYQDDSYPANVRLGWLNYLLGNYAESEKYYSKAVNLLPYSIEARLGYVLPLAELGNWSQVENIYLEILDIDPQNSLVNYRLASIYYSRKQYEKAYQHLEKVVNMYPMDYDSIILFAWTNFQTGNSREAKVLFQKALLLAPNDDSARQGLQMIK